MYQGGVATISPTHLKMGDGFRKRIGLKFSSGGAARCIFGPPDVKLCREMVQKTEAKNQWVFSKKWNVNITGNPEPPATMKSDTDPQPEYMWEDVHDENQMAECDRHRFETPMAPHGRPVPLLYAPTIKPRESLSMNSSKVSTESISIQTEVKIQVDQETQVEAQEMIDVSSQACFEEKPKKRKCNLSIDTSSSLDSLKKSHHPHMCQTPDNCDNCITTSVPSLKKERRLPKPLTIPPTSPCEMDEDLSDDPTSPITPGDSLLFGKAMTLLSPSESHRTPPLNRRNSIEVFTFPPVDSPSLGLKCLRIRNGSPSYPLSRNKKLKQRSITEYLQQVKKNKISCSKKSQ